ncbi:MAG: GNAT family N-acetyltransferase, partial [Thermoplasmata archaeon]|nr:GNAT family N-acetyltransferase [Thermoplasmata archaeon]
MSLAEAYVRKGSKILAVYNDDTMIGCVYYHIFKLPEGKKEAWITRFMIDQRYQGKGLGRETMNMLIAHIREEAGEDVSIGLSYEPENALAKKLYDSLGFVPRGKMLGEQVVVWLEV